MVTETREIHPDLQNHPFTLDNVFFVPTRIPNFEPSVVDYSVQLTQKIRLKRPVISSPMDTVTESEMAILVARMGGIGVIHAALPIEAQLAEIKKVRRWEAGFVLDPIVLGPETTIKDLLAEEGKRKFSSYPITEDGTLNTPMIGLVTKTDFQDYLEPRYHDMSVLDIMTPREKIFFGKKADTLDKLDIRVANRIIRERHIDTLPILDEEGRVVALVTRSDLDKNTNNPLATKDGNNQLQVMAAVTSRFIPAQARIEAIAKSGISGIVVDSRNIYGDYYLIAKFAKEQNPDLDVIVGNIVHPRVLRQVLEDAGTLIDAFRVGIGTGKICNTSENLGIGRDMGSALISIDQEFQEINRTDQYGYKGFIVDGGIKFPKHFLAGAALINNFAGVMMGTYLVGFDESPGKILEPKPGVNVKVARGMGSEAAISDRAGSSRYGVDQVDLSERFAEGVEIQVPYVGKGEPVLRKYFAGVKTGMHALGFRNIPELYQNVSLSPAVIAASKGTL